MIYAQPIYFWLLLLIPLLIAIFSFCASQKAKSLKRFGNPQLLAQLMPDASKRRAWAKLLLVCVALVFFIIGLTRPQTGAKRMEVKREGIEIIIALDVSNSMLAQDFTPNRLERAKQAISRLVERLQDDRIGLIVFAGASYVQLPVTSDYISAKLFLSSISPGMVARQGTAIGSAIELAMQSFSDDSNKSRVLIIISDGENHEDDAVAAAKKASEKGIVVHTIGIGSQHGVPITLENGSLLKDKDGNLVVTRLDEATLEQIAKAGNGFYTRATNADLGLEKLVDEIKQMDKEEMTAVVFLEYNEYYMYLFALAAIVLLLEPLLLERKNRFLNSIDIFRLKK